MRRGLTQKRHPLGVAFLVWVLGLEFVEGISMKMSRALADLATTYSPAS